jgi:hypothetical protein
MGGCNIDAREVFDKCSAQDNFSREPLHVELQDSLRNLNVQRRESTVKQMT